MTIGEAIKDIRLTLNLTEKEFSNEIISSAYLSKIETSKNEIRANILLELLRNNNVELISFLKKIGGVI